MKYRIGIWAAAGFLVASGWAVYFLATSRGRVIEPIVAAIARITCPIAIVGAHYPVSVYSAIAANVVTYSLLGLTVEIARRQFNRAN